MFNLNSLIVSFLFFTFVHSSVLFPTTKQETIEEILLYGALNYHYAPIKISDEYSSLVFTNYLDKLDPNKRFFTQTDIIDLSINKYAVDDQLHQGSDDFFTQASFIYNQRLNEVQEFLPSLFKEPFTFNSENYFETDSEKAFYQLNSDELYSYWKSFAEYQTLNQYITLKLADVSGNENINLKYNAEYEEKARDKTKKELTDYLKRLSKESFNSKLDIYNDSLLNVFDVHSNYYPPEDKEDFDINISGKLEGIGAVLREEDGFIKVVKIVPGSASWKQGDLKAEDVILKVAQKNDADFVDIVGARVRDAVKLIRGKKGTTVILKVKHTNGDIEDIPIVRDVVVIEETYAKSTIIKDTRFNRTFGYIYLPKFYRDFKNDSNRNTTDDVRSALLSLQKHDISGVILDLRHNEGGALIDARNTAGLFIEEGPIVQVKERNNSPRILKDQHKDIVYDGPLVILINSYSASASEILAAALQDYGRAVIIGAPSFGKGTVQTFIDLDNINPARASFFSPLGSMKLTIQKFYRINGGSTQHKGVIPDIVLKDQYQHLEIGERYYDNALEWDTVKKLQYNQWYKGPLSINELNNQSILRQKNSTDFQQFYTYINFIETLSKDTQLSLNANKRLMEKQESKQIIDEYKNSTTEYENLSITNIYDDSMTEALKESYKEWIDVLKTDIQVNEACAILNDLVNQIILISKN